MRAKRLNSRVIICFTTATTATPLFFITTATITLTNIYCCCLIVHIYYHEGAFVTLFFKNKGLHVTTNHIRAVMETEVAMHGNPEESKFVIF